MIDNFCRHVLERSTEGLPRFFQTFGVRPNHLTCLGGIFALCSAISIANGLLWPALLIWWLGRFFDGCDGILARATGQQSEFGAYLDIVLDMAAYSVMILGFAWFAPEFTWRWLAIVFLYVLCITSALALGQGEARVGKDARDNRSLRLGAGLAEAGETGIAYSLFLLFPQWLSTSSAIWLVVLVVTVVSRTWLAYRILR